MANLLERRNMMMPLSDNWLSKYALQVIITAFVYPQAYAVIQAANAYLNNIASEDFNKAYMLAGFINEDPMMVCSLGLQPQGVTMPIRWLVSDDKCCIDTGVHIIHGTSIEMYLQIIQDETLNLTNYAFGSFVSGNRYSIRTKNASPFDGITFQVRNGWVPSASGLMSGFDKHKIILSEGLCYVDNQSVTNSYQFIDNGLSNYIFCGNNGGVKDLFCREKVAYLKASQDGLQYKNFIPFKSATREGMVDLVNAAFHPNQGTGHFTDAYTLQDGVTPWTPGT